MKLIIIISVFIGVSLMLPGCGDSGSNTSTDDGEPDTSNIKPQCAVGEEGCACTGGGACDFGLVCLSHFCVDSGDTIDGTDTNTNPATSSDSNSDSDSVLDDTGHDSNNDSETLTDTDSNIVDTNFEDTDSNVNIDSDTTIDTDDCIIGDYEVMNTLDASLLAPYTCIDGSLIISSTALTTLPELAVQQISGNLTILSYATLTDMNGFSNLTTVSGGVNLSGPALSSVAGLAALETVGEYFIINNTNLTNLAGLEGMQLSTDAGVSIFSNTLLQNISALAGSASKLSKVELYDNPLVSDLAGLSDLASVSTLRISDTPITALQDLASLTTVTSALQISMNENLPYCLICPFISSLTGSFSTSISGNKNDSCNEQCSTACGDSYLPRIDCSGVCMFYTDNPLNCGGCGIVCDSSTPYCRNETCEPCLAHETLCQDTCVDTSNDPLHCGDCSTMCTGTTPYCLGAMGCSAAQLLDCSGTAQAGNSTKVFMTPGNMGNQMVFQGDGCTESMDLTVSYGTTTETPTGWYTGISNVPPNTEVTITTNNGCGIIIDCY